MNLYSGGAGLIRAILEKNIFSVCPGKDTKSSSSTDCSTNRYVTEIVDLCLCVRKLISHVNRVVRVVTYAVENLET